MLDSGIVPVVEVYMWRRCKEEKHHTRYIEHIFAKKKYRRQNNTTSYNKHKMAAQKEPVVYLYNTI